MSPHRTAATVAVLLLSLALPAVLPRSRAGRRGAQQFGEVNPNKALVYFIRTARLSGSGRTQYVYADQTFLGVIRSGSYGFAYLEPGPHLFWTNSTSGRPSRSSTRREGRGSSSRSRTS